MSRLNRRRAAALALGSSMLAAVTVSSPAGAEPVPGAGLIRVRSAYPVDETVARIRRDIADKGIMFFEAIDQQALAARAGIRLNASTLLVFGNPPLGAQFLTSNPYAGLDWPVRLLVLQDDAGAVWAVYTDFAWIARRHGITDREPQFATAAGVVASITSTVARR